MTTLGFALHPGEILREEFMAPLGLKAYTLARMLHVPRTRIERIADEKAPVTPNTALRLAKLFGTTPQFWMSMQAAYDLAREAKQIKDDIDRIVEYEAA